MWKNLVQPERPLVTAWCMRIACWISKATYTHEHTRTRKCVKLIAFPRQQWLRERPSMLHLYVYCVSLSSLRTPVFHCLQYLHILFLFLANTLAVTCLYCTWYSLYFFILIELFISAVLIELSCVSMYTFLGLFVWLYLFVNVLLFALF